MMTDIRRNNDCSLRGLAYLKKLDIDYLKIDQSFVSPLEEDQDDTAF